MNRFTLPAITAVLTLSFAIPVSAQATVGDLPVCRMPIEARKNHAPPAPTASALPPGRETSTLPWSAPVGHRQPQAADVISTKPSSIDQALVQENARIDRVIQGVCRGC